MQYTDILNKVYFLTSTNSTSFPIAQITVEANNAYDRVVSLIMNADNRWQFDDSNNTDLPIATTALTANQQDYSLSVSHLEITRAEVLDQSGVWHLLVPLDQTDVYNQSLTQFQNTAGTPIYYDKIGSSVFLYPAPNYTQTASLKLYYKRGPSYFTTSDTTKSPGFNSLFHELIPLWVAYNFAIANGKSNSTLIYNEIQSKEAAIVDEYAVRNKDDRPGIRAHPFRFR